MSGDARLAGAYAPQVYRDQRSRALSRVLAAAEAASPVEAVEAVTCELGLALRATKVSFLIADMSGRALVRLAHVRLRTGEGTAMGVDRSGASGERRALEESATVLPFDGGPGEQAVRTQEVQVVEPQSGGSASDGSESWLVLAPVTERGEAIGVLEMTLPDRPDTVTRESIARLAHVLAFVVIANQRHTDLYEWGQRTRPLSLSAEIQHQLLPGPQTCEAGSFTLAGWLEPAAAIAAHLRIAVRALDKRLERLYRKLGCHNRAGAVHYALTHHLA